METHGTVPIPAIIFASVPSTISRCVGNGIGSLELEAVMLGRTNSMPQATAQGSHEVGCLVACLLLLHYAEPLYEIGL